MVAANRQRVAVTGHDPYLQLRAGDLESGGDRRRAAVDRVESVGVHVVRETARATDAGDEHEVLAWQTELRHDALDLIENRVVAAPRAPANLLSGGSRFVGHLP